MKRLIITIIALLFLVASTGYTDWRYNPFTGKLDWYMGEGDSPTFLAPFTLIDAGGTTIFTVNITGETTISNLAPVVGTMLLLPQENDVATPTLAFGDGDSGFYESTDDSISISLATILTWRFAPTYFGYPGTNYPAFLYEAVTNTNPNIVPSWGDQDTGIGATAGNADQLSLIAGGVEGIRVTRTYAIHQIGTDLAIGNVFTFNSAANIELTDADAEQAWVSIEDKYNQTNTAAGGSILVKSLLTGVGDASSGKGYNFFADFRVDDTNDTSLYNIARMHVAKIHSSNLFDAVALTDSVTIWTQPANSRLENVVIVLEAQFVAAGMTDLDVIVGDAGDNDGILLEAMNLTSDAVGLDYSLKGAYWSATTAGVYYTTAAKAWLAYSTAVGANLSTTSAGEVIFYFIYTQY